MAGLGESLQAPEQHVSMSSSATEVHHACRGGVQIAIGTLIIQDVLVAVLFALTPLFAHQNVLEDKSEQAGIAVGGTSRAVQQGIKLRLGPLWPAPFFNP